ncbi:hypothetical protein [Glycomyces sp. NPDC021274]|uniref:hypothetical protein n=1 Tax=Glycomyces sp. NPDC021274 TaxID=3155120 RepID=UPI0033FB91E0
MTDAQDRWAGLQVTNNPELEARLRERVDTLSSRELAEYAHSLGLYPPGFEEGRNPPIALAWPAWMPDDADGVLVWDIGDGDE